MGSVIRSEDLPTAREDLARLARGVGRDALLAVDATLLWTEPEDSPATRTALAWLIEHTDVPLFVGSRAPLETGAGLIARIEKIDKEAQEAKLLVDEEKKVHSTYSLLAIAKVFEEKKSSVKKED